MNRNLHKIFLIAVMIITLLLPTIKLWAQSNPTTTGPIGTQLAYGVNEDIKYWNGTVWVAIPSGLPGQSLTFQNGIPTWVNNPNAITTNVVTNITGTTATCGGHIASSSGSPITARGVCWSTNHNPTLSDAHTSDDIGKGNFTSSLTGLTAGTIYYVRAYAINTIGTAYGSEVSFTTLSPPVIDYDGNVYDTIHIGTQIWMKQNLKVTHYKDGTAIPYPGTNNNDWANNYSGAYAWYNNNEAVYKNPYGALYKWYTAATGNLCPTGWHVPDAAELYTLVAYLGGGSIASGKLLESGLIHWNSPNTGANNESGFTALPGGLRQEDGTYSGIGNGCFFWSSDLANANHAWGLYLYSSVYLAIDGTLITYGLSVRCIKD